MGAAAIPPDYAWENETIRCVYCGAMGRRVEIHVHIRTQRRSGNDHRAKDVR
jgi:hypothetical protein